MTRAWNVFINPVRKDWFAYYTTYCYFQLVSRRSNQRGINYNLKEFGSNLQLVQRVGGGLEESEQSSSDQHKASGHGAGSVCSDNTGRSLTRSGSDRDSASAARSTTRSEGGDSRESACSNNRVTINSDSLDNCGDGTNSVGVDNRVAIDSHGLDDSAENRRSGERRRSNSSVDGARAVSDSKSGLSSGSVADVVEADSGRTGAVSSQSLYNSGDNLADVANRHARTGCANGDACYTGCDSCADSAVAGDGASGSRGGDSTRAGGRSRGRASKRAVRGESSGDADSKSVCDVNRAHSRGDNVDVAAQTSVVDAIATSGNSRLKLTDENVDLAEQFLNVSRECLISASKETASVSTNSDFTSSTGKGDQPGANVTGDAGELAHIGLDIDSIRGRGSSILESTNNVLDTTCQILKPVGGSK